MLDDLVLVVELSVQPDEFLVSGAKLICVAACQEMDAT